MKKIFIYSFICLFIYFLTRLFVFTTFAQSAAPALNLTAYPSTFEISAKPDSSVQQKFRIRNNTDATQSLSISIKKLVPDPKGGVTIRDFTNNDTYQTWIKFDPSVITAQPREWTDINFSIQIPKDTAFGYYYVIYIAPKDTTAQANQPQAHVTGSLAIPILLTVQKPGATLEGKMLSFMNKSSFNEYLPISFDTTFINSGNLHIRPTGNIFIKDWTGNTVDVLTINSNGGSILPGAKRIYTTSWDNSFITKEPVMQDDTIQRDKNGNPQTHLVFHFDHVLNLRIGKYTAVALTVIPTQKRDISFETSTTFWVFPWKFVAVALLFVVLAGVGLVNTGKSIFKTIQKAFKR